MEFEKVGASNNLVSQNGNQADLAINKFADAIANKQAVIDLSGNTTYNINKVPSSFTFSSASDNGAGGATVTQLAFNNAALGAAITTNGGAGGAGSIVNAFGDGNGGLIYDQFMRMANNAQGVLMLGFTVIATVGGVQSTVPLNTLNMQLVGSNGQQGLVPVTFDVGEALRNNAFLAGTLTVKARFFLNAISQIRFSLPQNTTISFTFFTGTSGFKG